MKIKYRRYSVVLVFSLVLLLSISNAVHHSETYNALFIGCQPHNTENLGRLKARINNEIEENINSSRLINLDTYEIYSGDLYEYGGEEIYMCPGRIDERITSTRNEYTFQPFPGGHYGNGTYEIICYDFPDPPTTPDPDGEYRYVDSNDINRKYDDYVDECTNKIEPGLTSRGEDPCYDVKVGYPTPCDSSVNSSIISMELTDTSYPTPHTELSTGYPIMVMAGKFVVDDNSDEDEEELSSIVGTTYSIDWISPSDLGAHNLSIALKKIVYEVASRHDCDTRPSYVQYFYYEPYGPDEGIQLFEGRIRIVNLIANGSIVNIQANGNPIDPTSGIPVNPDGAPTHITITVSNDGASNTEQNLAMPITVENVVVISNPSDCFIFTPTTPLPSSAIPVGDTINIEGDLSANPTSPHSPHNCNDATISFNVQYKGISKDCNGTIPEGNDVWTYNRSKNPDYVCSIPNIIANFSDTIVVSINTSNIGGGPGGNPSNTYIRILPSGYEESFNIPSLNTGQTITNSTQIICNYSTPQTVWGYADVNGNISESDENNNKCNATITCTSYPDYVATCTGGTGYWGDNVTYTVTTRNDGQDASLPSITNISVVGIGVIGNYSVGPLSSGGSQSEDFTFECITPGLYEIHSCADAYNVINERIEANNCGTCIINCLSNYTCIDYV